MCESLEGERWLYRGVPAESPEVADVRSDGEVCPPRPDRTGEYWRQVHVAGMTETGYTSWTTDRSIAEAAAEEAATGDGLSGRVWIFRVPVGTLNMERVFEGRDDECEYLIEGRVEGVRRSPGAADEEDDEDEDD